MAVGLVEHSHCHRGDSSSDLVGVVSEATDMDYPNTSRQIRQIAESLESLEAQCCIALQIVQESLTRISREASVLQQLSRQLRDSGGEHDS